ncbi:PREDICTED: agamous-like MADS-box protein AGL62 [Nicotiana attenuata]|uniref:Agamous-like mads-box protein agl62 n=1 Tax=Nicotiana attenuata TaxID=49451 RepID=A0A314KIB7_NICAT|nr:PREDICTED: agamous-like MADS-box protein AGL62 [Nicotiana attenuata]OIT29047.1 agamous-like mads-box protein agl62 [Nicotiana attenuata]
MVSKKTKGRQKILMKKIEKKDDLFATFSKRRAGIYKKSGELNAECGVDVGIIVSSPTGKPFSFFHPTDDAIIARFQNPDMQLSEITRLIAANARNNVNYLNSRLEEFDTIKDVVTAQTRFYDKMTETRESGWWESIEQLNADEVTKFETWLKTVVSIMNNCLNQLEIGASSSAPNYF